jgi:hypothetical protein
MTGMIEPRPLMRSGSTISVTDRPRTIEPPRLMRYGVAASVCGHAAILALGLVFAGASPFDSVPAEAIAVDIVSPDEIAPAPNESPPRPDPTFGFGAAAPPATEAPTPQAQTQPSPPTQTQPRTPPQRNRQAAVQPSPVEPPRQPPAQQQVLPQLLPQPQFPPQFQPPPQALPPEPHEPTAADMFGMPMALPDGKLGGGFDAPAIDKAKLERDDIVAFRNHLRSCLTLPAGMNTTDSGRIVLRVTFRPNGTLAAKPEPIEVGGASSIGPALFAGAVAALQKCQPYAMLPADKYKEWKVLDLPFTPQDFTGG